LKNKFLKYQKILKEKDSQIDSLQNNSLENQYLGNSKNYFFFDLHKDYNNLFNFWMIVDSIDSYNGPSDWNIKNIFEKNDKNFSEEKKIILMQTSNIITNNKTCPSTSILFKNKIISDNIYFKFTFLPKSSGEVYINFKHLDFENNLQLRVKRESEDRGKITLFSNINGKSKLISDLDCERMNSFLKKCSGFELEQLNKIEIFSYKEQYIFLFNEMIIFSISLNQFLLETENNNKKKTNRDFLINQNFHLKNVDKKTNNYKEKFYWTSSRIQIGINDQKNFEVHDLQIKVLDFEDIKRFQNEISDLKNYVKENDFKNIKLKNFNNR